MTTTKTKPKEIKAQPETKVTIVPTPAELQVILDECIELVRTNQFTDDDLWQFIRIFLGIEVPRVSHCKNHSAPFDFIADGFFGRYPTDGGVVHANRGGGKTLDVAILHICLMILKPGYELAHVGAVERQGMKCYEYFIGFSEMAPLDDQFSKTLLKDAQTHSGSKLQNIPGTYAAVSGPHPNGLTFDEIEEAKGWEVIEKAMGCPMSLKGYNSFILFLSTRDFVGGIMDKMLARVGRVGWAVYTWCIWDVIERCPDHRQCKNCPALTQARCNGKAKTVPGGFYKINDFIQKSGTVDDDTWISQYLCLTPARSGRVYKEFDRKNHVTKTALRFDPALPIYVLCDPGFTNPFVLLWVQFDSMDRMIVVKERRWVGYTDDEVCTELLEYAKKTPRSSINYLPVNPKKTPQKRIEFVCDTASPDVMRTFRRMLGWSIRRGWKKAENEIEDIKLVRGAIKLRNDGTSGLLISSDCVGSDEDNPGLIEEMEQLSWKKSTQGLNQKDEIRDYRNHGPDAVKYGVKAVIHGIKRGEHKIKAGGRVGLNI